MKKSIFTDQGLSLFSLFSEDSPFNKSGVMKRVFLIVVVIFTLISAIPGNARNRWNIYGGGNMSHIYGAKSSSGDPLYRWGAGAFIGIGYEIRFTSRFSLTPALELSYIDNGSAQQNHNSTLSSNYIPWMNSYILSMPVIASTRIPISENIRFRIGGGFYIQEALSGNHYAGQNDKKEALSGNASPRFNMGPIGEAAIETGRHISYILRAQYPLTIQNDAWITKTLTLSAGIRYTF